MSKWRKKPLVIEAIQWDGENWMKVYDFCFTNSGGKRTSAARLDPKGGMWIETKEGEIRAKHGDYIIKGVAGEFYPCDEDIFAQSYERV